MTASLILVVMNADFTTRTSALIQGRNEHASTSGISSARKYAVARRLLRDLVEECSDVSDAESEPDLAVPLDAWQYAEFASSTHEQNGCVARWTRTEAEAVEKRSKQAAGDLGCNRVWFSYEVFNEHKLREQAFLKSRQQESAEAKAWVAKLRTVGGTESASSGSSSKASQKVDGLNKALGSSGPKAQKATTSKAKVQPRKQKSPGLWRPTCRTLFIIREEKVLEGASDLAQPEPVGTDLEEPAETNHVAPVTRQPTTPTPERLALDVAESSPDEIPGTPPSLASTQPYTTVSNETYRVGLLFSVPETPPSHWVPFDDEYVEPEYESDVNFTPPDSSDSEYVPSQKLKALACSPKERPRRQIRRRG